MHIKMSDIVDKIINDSLRRVKRESHFHKWNTRCQQKGCSGSLVVNTYYSVRLHFLKTGLLPQKVLGILSSQLFSYVWNNWSNNNNQGLQHIFRSHLKWWLIRTQTVPPPPTALGAPLPTHNVAKYVKRHQLLGCFFSFLFIIQ